MLSQVKTLNTRLLFLSAGNILLNMSDEQPEQNSDQPSDDQGRPPITIYYQDQKMENLKTGLTSQDLLIAARLEKLREDRMKEVPKDNTSIEKRLADLKGVVSTTVGKINTLTFDSRSTTEKTNDLIKQFLDELKIDKSIDMSTRSEIESGLASLKSSKANNEDINSDSEDEETAVNKLVQRFTEEASLKPVSNNLNSDDELESPNLDENDEVSSWCIICNEDASLKCLDCEGDIYCYSCFHKGHEEWNMNHHKSVPFKKTSEQ